jgi:hypothetical protein
MSALGSLLYTLALRLPADERDLLRARLQEHDDVHHLAGSRSADEHDTPDWEFVWTLLLEASTSLGRLENRLSDERAFFNFSPPVEPMIRGVVSPGLVASRDR